MKAAQVAAVMKIHPVKTIYLNLHLLGTKHILTLALGVLSLGYANAAAVLDFQSANYDFASSTWNNAAGGNVNKANSNVGARPALLTNATPSGASALDFSAGGKLFYLTSPLTAPAFTSTPTFTLFFVGQSAPTSATTDLQAVLFGDTLGDLAYRLNNVISSTVAQTVTKMGVADLGASSPAATEAGYHVFSVVYDGANYSYYTDGALTGTAASTVTFGPGTGSTYIGYNPLAASQIFKGQMAALVLYDTALTSGEIGTINTALANTYTVPEPATWALLAFSLTTVMVFRRRRNS